MNFKTPPSHLIPLALVTAGALLASFAISPAKDAEAASSRVDLSTLTPAQRATYNKVATEEFCSCDSSLTISGCLATRPKCRIAERLAELVKRGCIAGANSDELLAFLSHNVMGPFCRNPVALPLTQAPQTGASDAPVTLIEFADFRCSHCRAAAPKVHAVLDSYGKKRVKFVFVPFPLQDHPSSVLAAKTTD
jgi:thiol-disulfide isomerase/thioredoxin